MATEQEGTNKEASKSDDPTLKIEIGPGVPKKLKEKLISIHKAHSEVLMVTLVKAIMVSQVTVWWISILSTIFHYQSTMGAYHHTHQGKTKF